MQQKNPKCDATRIILTEDSRWLFTCGANSHFSLWSVDQKNKKITLTQTLERHKDTVIALLLVKNERYGHCYYCCLYNTVDDTKFTIILYTI